jgi:hypothetical protein
MKKTFFAVVALMAILIGNRAAAAPLPPELAEAASRGKLLSLQSWNPTFDIELICAIALPPGLPKVGRSELIVYQGTKRIFSFTSEQSPVAMFTVGGEAGNLATIWETGEGTYILSVFVFEDGQVKRAFEDRSKLMPELVYSAIPPAFPHSHEAKNPSAYAIERIIVTKMDWVHDPGSGDRVFMPLTANIYTWDGKHYQLQKGVKWSERLK